MFKFNFQGLPDSRQCPIDGVKEVVATYIVLRSDPFGFAHALPVLFDDFADNFLATQQNKNG